MRDRKIICATIWKNIRIKSKQNGYKPQIDRHTPGGLSGAALSANGKWNGRELTGRESICNGPAGKRHFKVSAKRPSA